MNIITLFTAWLAVVMDTMLLYLASKLASLGNWNTESLYPPSEHTLFLHNLIFYSAGDELLYFDCIPSLPPRVHEAEIMVQEIMKQHTLPRLLTNHQPGLWLNFVEKAVAFERQMAPLQGIPEAEQAGAEQPVLWRRGSSIATICAIQVIHKSYFVFVSDLHHLSVPVLCHGS